MEVSEQTIQQMLDEYLEYLMIKKELMPLSDMLPFFSWRFCKIHNIHIQGTPTIDRYGYNINLTGGRNLVNLRLEERAIKYLKSLGWEVKPPIGFFQYYAKKTEFENGDLAKLIWNSLQAYNKNLDDNGGYEIGAYD